MSPSGSRAHAQPAHAGAHSPHHAPTHTLAFSPIGTSGSTRREDPTAHALYGSTTTVSPTPPNLAYQKPRYDLPKHARTESVWPVPRPKCSFRSAKRCP